MTNHTSNWDKTDAEREEEKIMRQEYVANGYNLSNDVLNMIPKHKIEERHKEYWGKGFDEVYKASAEDRARMLASEIKSKIATNIPKIINEALQKLALINTLAHKVMDDGTAKNFIYLEKIENASIKAEMHSARVWQMDDVIEDDLNGIDPSWVVSLEDLSLKDMQALAESLRDKILLKDKIKDIPKIDNWELHKTKCTILRVDPFEAGELEVEEKWDRACKLVGEDTMNEELKGAIA